MRSDDAGRSIPDAMTRRLCLAAVLFILGSIGSVSAAPDASDTTEPSPLPGAYRILSEDGNIEIPFEIFRGDIRFQCEVNGHPVHMLLDDGFMWDQLLFWGSDEVDLWNLAYDGEIGVGKEGAELLTSRTASGIKVTFADVELIEQAAVVTPNSSGNSRMWFGSVGQISAAFFRHFVVDINFDKMVITLLDPDGFEYTGKGVSVLWQPMGFGPWSIPATLRLGDGRAESLKLLMDLGYNDQLPVVVGGEHNITLPEQKLPAGLGRDIQGTETRGFIGRLSQIDIGGYQIDDLLVSYVSEEHSDHAVHEGMIGLRLLSRFNLVFDYNRKKLFVEPNKSFNTPFEYDMSGFEIGAMAESCRVVSEVTEGSAAQEAGLQVGDRICKINNRNIADYDTFELLSMFENAGAEINLLVERDGKNQELTFVLRRII